MSQELKKLSDLRRRFGPLTVGSRYFDRLERSLPVQIEFKNEFFCRSDSQFGFYLY